MTKNLIVLTLLLSSFGLTAQNNKETTNIIPKEKIGVHNRTFNLEGFYFNKRMNVKTRKDTAKFIDPIIFYEDGTVLNFDYIGNSSSTLSVKGKEKRCTLKPRQDFDTIIEFFKCYSEVVDKREINSVYSIDGNIIRIQHIGPDYFMEEQGVVVNDSVFVLRKRINYLTKKESSQNFIYQFQTSKKPASTGIKRSSTIVNNFFR